jgi:exopolysaccharide production protein ExoQ
MASIALFLSLAFSTWFIVRDIRRRRSVSGAIWIPTILVLILGSRAVSLWFESDAQFVGLRNDAQRSMLDEAFFLLVLVGSWLIASSRGVKWGRFLVANPALVLLYLFFAISILWSGDPFGSTKRLLKDFGELFVIAVILSEKDPLEAMQAAYFRCASLLFPLSIVFVRYYPRLGRAYSAGGELMITGVTTQKNSLGEIVLVFSLFLVWDCLDAHPARMGTSGTKIPWDRLVLLLMGAYLVQLSQSKTALTCLLIGLALIVRSGWLASKPISRMVLAGAMSVPVLLFFTQQFSSVIAPLIEALGRDMTFTGRTDIWAHITATTVNPLIGAGYWNFWGGKGGHAIELAMRTVVQSAHCGYLDIYLDGGWIAISLLLTLLLTSGRRLIKGLQRNRFQRVRFAILIVIIIYNISESMFFRITPIWFATLLAMVEFPSLDGAVGTGEVGGRMATTQSAIKKQCTNADYGSGSQRPRQQPASASRELCDREEELKWRGK